MGKLPRFNLFTLPGVRMRCFVYTVSRLETSPFGDTFISLQIKKPSPEYIRVLAIVFNFLSFKSRVLRNKLLPTPLHPAPSMIQIKKKSGKHLLTCC